MASRGKILALRAITGVKILADLSSGFGLESVSDGGSNAKKIHHFPPFPAVRLDPRRISRSDNKVGDFMGYYLFNEILPVGLQKFIVVANAVGFPTGDTGGMALQIEAQADLRKVCPAPTLSGFVHPEPRCPAQFAAPMLRRLAGGGSKRKF